MGKHNKQEILQVAAHSLESLSVLLADKPYLFGTSICSFDATVYAFLAQLILVDLDNDFVRLARRHDNLVKYCQRMHQRYYTDT